MNIFIPVSIGEVFDKLSILHLKIWNIKDPEKLKVIDKEIRALESAMGEQLKSAYLSDSDYCNLLKINKDIWDKIEESNAWNFCYAENKEQSLEREKVYKSLNVLNNQRFIVKNRINQRFDSSVNEVKSHL